MLRDGTHLKVGKRYRAALASAFRLGQCDRHALALMASWVAVLLGQGIVPQEQEPAANAIDEAMFADALDKMRESYRSMAEHMPSHAEFIAQACPAG